jgi:hypothetical protein
MALQTHHDLSSATKTFASFWRPKLFPHFVIASFGVGEVFKSTGVFIVDTRVLTFAQILSSSLRLHSSQAAASEDE